MRYKTCKICGARTRKVAIHECPACGRAPDERDQRISELEKALEAMRRENYALLRGAMETRLDLDAKLRLAMQRAQTAELHARLQRQRADDLYRRWDAMRRHIEVNDQVAQ